MPVQGKQINNTAVSLITTIYKYFKSQKNKSKGPFGNIEEKNDGFCTSSVYRVVY